jgi:hypothetical protein
MYIYCHNQFIDRYLKQHITCIAQHDIASIPISYSSTKFSYHHLWLAIFHFYMFSPWQLLAIDLSLLQFINHIYIN